MHELACVHVRIACSAGALICLRPSAVQFGQIVSLPACTHVQSVAARRLHDLLGRALLQRFAQVGVTSQALHCLSSRPAADGRAQPCLPIQGPNRCEDNVMDSGPGGRCKSVSFIERSFRNAFLLTASAVVTNSIELRGKKAEFLL